MREPIVFTNIADQATDEAFNTQVRQFINFLVERIDEMIKCFHEFDEHEIQSELAYIRWSTRAARNLEGPSKHISGLGHNPRAKKNNHTTV